MWHATDIQIAKSFLIKNLELLNFTYRCLILHKDFTLCACSSCYKTGLGHITCAVCFCWVGGLHRLHSFGHLVVETWDLEL
jgi:hypothetical protein